jgi:hypothetical protein
MSTGERVLVRLQDGSENVGQITRRTDDGLVLDTRAEVTLAGVRAITSAPPQPPKRDKRDWRLAACAHAFGYRGHCLTKSRRWSTTFKELRQAREDHVREQLLIGSDRARREPAQLADGERITAFEFVGVGHLTTADAFLAAQAAARARENRELAREALCDQRQRWTEHRWGATPREPTGSEGPQP